MSPSSSIATPWRIPTTPSEDVTVGAFILIRSADRYNTDEGGLPADGRHHGEFSPQRHGDAVSLLTVAAFDECRADQTPFDKVLQSEDHPRNDGGIIQRKHLGRSEKPANRTSLGLCLRQHL